MINGLEFKITFHTLYKAWMLIDRSRFHRPNRFRFWIQSIWWASMLCWSKHLLFFQHEKNLFHFQSDHWPKIPHRTLSLLLSLGNCFMRNCMSIDYRNLDGLGLHGCVLNTHTHIHNCIFHSSLVVQKIGCPSFWPTIWTSRREWTRFTWPIMLKSMYAYERNITIL